MRIEVKADHRDAFAPPSSGMPATADREENFILRRRKGEARSVARVVEFKAFAASSGRLVNARRINRLDARDTDMRRRLAPRLETSDAWAIGNNGGRIRRDGLPNVGTALGWIGAIVAASVALELALDTVIVG